jgi:hypothetical protein
MAFSRCEGSLAFPFIAQHRQVSEDDRARHRSTVFTVPRLAGRFDLSLLRRHLPTRSAHHLVSAVSDTDSMASSTHGVRQRRPSIDITSRVHSRTSRRSSFGAPHAKRCTRAVLVVPPDSDGLLLLRLRRSVAPCSRSWGSLCFDPRVHDSRSYATMRDLPYSACPSKLFPRKQQ